MVVGGGGVEVGEVAAAVAGREELAAHPGLTLGEENGVLRVLQGCQSGQHSGGASADYENGLAHGSASSLRRVR